MSARPITAVCSLWFAMVGAHAADAAQEPVSLDVHGSWRIEQARSEPLLDRRRARLVFGADSRLSGHTSCNPLEARYALDGAALKIGPIATGRASCSPLGLEQEDRVLSALEAAVSARVRPDGLLELRDSDGRGLLRATRLGAQAGEAP